LMWKRSAKSSGRRGRPSQLRLLARPLVRGFGNPTGVGADRLGLEPRRFGKTPSAGAGSAADDPHRRRYTEQPVEESAARLAPGSLQPLRPAFVPRLCWTCDGSSSAAKDSAKTAQAVGSLNETEFIDCLTAVQSSTFKCSKSDPNGELPDFENFRSSTCSTVRVGTVQSIHSEAYASNFASESDLRRRITLSPGRETRSKERHTVVRPVTVARRDPYFCAPFVLVGDGK
jgi:hypothetical protein